MKAADLANVIQRSIETNPADADADAYITVYSPGTLGAQPTVGIDRANFGFDWDHGKFLIRPTQHLTKLTREEVVAIRDSVARSQSWHAFQREKALRERIRDLEVELAALKGSR
jgi:hypothetical protein